MLAAIQYMDLQAVKKAALQIADPLLHGSPPTMEATLALVVGGLFCILTMGVVGRAQGLGHMNWQHGFISLAGGVFLFFLILIPVQMHILPLVSDATARTWIMRSAMAVVVLGAVVPVQSRISRGTYWQGLVNLALSIAAGVAVVVLANMIIEAAETQKTEFAKIKTAKDARQEDMDGTR